jgi:hypothetical protein
MKLGNFGNWKLGNLLKVEYTTDILMAIAAEAISQFPNFKIPKSNYHAIILK